MNKRRKLIAGISAMSILGAGIIPTVQTVNDYTQEHSQKISQNDSRYINAKTSNVSMQTTTGLNVRSGAGTKYKVLGTLKKGQKITVKSTSNGWAKFTYNGKTAYVSAKYLKAVTVSNDNQSNNNQVNAQTGSKNMQTTAGLNVRSGAGTKYKVLGTLKKGQKITVKSTSNGWAKFTYNGKTAYVSAKYLKAVTVSNDNQSNNNQSNNNQSGNTETNTQSKSMQTTAGLNVRNGAGTKYSKIGLLKKGEKVTVISTSNGWAKIKYGSGYGYVSASYLKDVTTGNNNTNTGSNTNTGTNTGNTNTGTNTGSNDNNNTDNTTYRTVHYSTLYNALIGTDGWEGLEGDADILGYYGQAIILSKNIRMEDKDLLNAIGVMDTMYTDEMYNLKNKELKKVLNLITNSESVTNTILNDMKNNSKNFTKVYGDLKITIIYHPDAFTIMFE